MKLHGGDIYGIAKEWNLRPEECLDFSANLNPLGTPSGVQEAMSHGLELVKYYPDPDCTELRELLSEKHSLPAAWIMIGNGAADLIFRLVYAAHPSKALIPAPTFLEYEEALKQIDTEICYWEMGNSFTITEDFLACMEPSHDILFLCNPNNPTGILIDSDLLKRIVDRARELDILVVMDECFLEFTGLENSHTMIPCIAQYPNIIIIRSFTKMFAIPGIRIGYALCANERLLIKIKKAGQSWSVNAVAAAAGAAALKEEAFRIKSIEYIKKEREFLKKALTAVGFFVYPGSADYLFFRADGCQDLYERLLQDKIIIRQCRNYRGLNHFYYRIAVKKHEDNRKLIQSIENITNQLEQIKNKDRNSF